MYEIALADFLLIHFPLKFSEITFGNRVYCLVPVGNKSPGSPRPTIVVSKM